mmetsp:Transcript_23390/g.54329  ORF Transcript_23390/g.54329 Transcript_23390/m.54329 type:complete len:281 (-) Transcript_23390:577-1419(-)
MLKLQISLLLLFLSCGCLGFVLVSPQTSRPWVASASVRWNHALHAEKQKKKRKKRKQLPTNSGEMILKDDDGDELEIVKEDEIMERAMQKADTFDFDDPTTVDEVLDELDFSDTEMRDGKRLRKKKKKIKRSDREAYFKLLKENPYADADDSNFEEEDRYSPANILLGERSKSFLGLKTGPLQVGHFVAAVTIALSAFVEYPGFPLTNLPIPIRQCLQGSLASVYAINTVLAVIAIFKAMERGQPVAIWVCKTFFVGGLAYDQLTQIPKVENKDVPLATA